MLAKIVIEVSPAAHGRFSASVGSEIVCTSRTPLLSAARRLLDRGLPPDTPLAMRYAGSATIAMHTTIGLAAGLTVEERSGGGGPRFAPYHAFLGTGASRQR